MIRVAVSPDDPDPRAIAQAVDVLAAGGVVAFPTDTLYGLAVDPRQDVALEKLLALKGRNRAQAVPLVAADVSQATVAGRFGPLELRLAAAFWPGPLSIVVPARQEISRVALGGGETVAIRVPAHAIARALAAGLGFCVTATSANPSQLPPAESADRVAAMLGEVDLLIDGGGTPGGLPSTIVAIGADGPVLVRAGATAWDRVLKSLQ
jgi:L-threonylcarbamoyladenylate synthase